MNRYFNINGVCDPAKHYMVNLDSRLQYMRRLVERGDYFVINRARQYGKTTMLNQLRRSFSEEYTVFFISFEGCGDAMFETEASLNILVRGNRQSGRQETACPD